MKDNHPALLLFDSVGENGFGEPAKERKLELCQNYNKHELHVKSKITPTGLFYVIISYTQYPLLLRMRCGLVFCNGLIQG